MPGSGGNELPVVEGITMFNREGMPIAELGPFWGPQATTLIRNVTVSLESAPAGGNLLVQLSVPSSNNAAAGPLGTGSSQVPFSMEIQRQEVGSALAIAGAAAMGGVIPSLVRSGIGALTTSTMGGQGGDSGPSPNLAETPMADVAANASPIVVDQGEAIPSESASGEAPAGSFDVRLSSGPLASRSASPLGPALATVMADPAPPVDRHERALSQSIDESESAEDPATKPRRMDYVLDEEGVLSSRTDSKNRSKAGDTRVALAGLGAFPLKVTDLRGQGDRLELESLLASASRSASIRTSVRRSSRPRTTTRTTLLAFLHADSGRSPRADDVAPDYLTTACGLALGLGLTAGPLFPDILALIASGSSRWRRGVLSRSTSRKPAPTPGPASGIGNWLRSPLSSRLRRQGR